MTLQYHIGMIYLYAFPPLDYSKTGYLLILRTLLSCFPDDAWWVNIDGGEQKVTKSINIELTTGYFRELPPIRHNWMEDV